MIDFLIFAAVVIVCLIVTIIYLYPVCMRQLDLYLLHAKYTVVTVVTCDGSAGFVRRRYGIGKDYTIGTLHCNWLMCAHSTQAFSTSSVPIV